MWLRKSLTEAEKKMLPMGAKLMTRTQFELVADMERKWGKMEGMVGKY